MTEHQTCVRKKNVSCTRVRSTCTVAKKIDTELLFDGVLTAPDACFGQGVKDWRRNGAAKETY
jgi:hypothetical protein